MFQEERLKEILSILEKKRIISVEELEAALYVSGSTVRRDLAELSRRELVVRSSGGAIAMSQRKKNDPLMLERQDSGMPQNAIGHAAAALVKEGDLIFLGACAAAMAMLPDLRAMKEVTIITNSTDVATAICRYGMSVYCSSGKYFEHCRSFCGPQAAHFLRRFNIDKAFFSCDALTTRGMLAYTDLDLMEVLQEIQANARQKILLCSGSRIGETASCNILDVSRIDTIITDAPERLKDLPCEVIAAE
jgi:DeoR/GlpR family transcriptional regulator of sugar metabolism